MNRGGPSFRRRSTLEKGARWPANVRRGCGSQKEEVRACVPPTMYSAATFPVHNNEARWLKRGSWYLDGTYRALNQLFTRADCTPHPVAPSPMLWQLRLPSFTPSSNEPPMDRWVPRCRRGSLPLPLPPPPLFAGKQSFRFGALRALRPPTIVSYTGCTKGKRDEVGSMMEMWVCYR